MRDIVFDVPLPAPCAATMSPSCAMYTLKKRNPMVLLVNDDDADSDVNDCRKRGAGRAARDKERRVVST